MIIRHFFGIHNTVSARSIPDNALADGVNVRIDNAGAVLKRRGYQANALPISITAAYSTQGQVGFLVSNGRLLRVGAGLVVADLGASSATRFCEFNGVVFTNDGYRVDGDRVVSLKLETPSSPLVLRKVSGDFPAGLYRATYTYINSEGLESGCAPIAEIELGENEGFYVVPPVAPIGYEVIVYVTETNGTAFAGNGVDLEPSQVLAGSFPVADTIAFYEGCLWASETLKNHSVIRHSLPFHYHLWNYAEDIFTVPGEVRAMMAANGGLVIGTDLAIYAYAEDSLVTLANYGVPRGKAFSQLPDGNVMIHSNRGQCVALPFKNLNDSKVSLPPGETCSTAITHMDGIMEFIILNDGGGTAFNRRY